MTITLQKHIILLCTETYSDLALRQLAEVEREKKMFYVYAIFNKQMGKLYIGQTINIQQSLIEHNARTHKGYTSRFSGEWELIL